MSFQGDRSSGLTLTETPTIAKSTVLFAHFRHGKLNYSRIQVSFKTLGSRWLANSSSKQSFGLEQNLCYGKCTRSRLVHDFSMRYAMNTRQCSHQHHHHRRPKNAEMNRRKTLSADGRWRHTSRHHQDVILLFSRHGCIPPEKLSSGHDAVYVPVPVSVCSHIIPRISATILW